MRYRGPCLLYEPFCPSPTRSLLEFPPNCRIESIYPPACDNGLESSVSNDQTAGEPPVLAHRARLSKPALERATAPDPPCSPTEKRYGSHSPRPSTGAAGPRSPGQRVLSRMQTTPAY